MVARNDAFKTGQKGSQAASLCHRCKLRNYGSSLRVLCNCVHGLVARLALEAARAAGMGEGEQQGTSRRTL
jgi:hypothetical protein